METGNRYEPYRLVDFAVHRLPDVVVLPLTVSALGGLGGAALLLPGTDGSWRTPMLGSFTLGACYLVVFLINPRGFGFGDVKLASALGPSWVGTAGGSC